MGSLTDTTVFLTGATSGIGLATARRLASETGTLIVHGPEPTSDIGDLLSHLRTLQRPGGRLEYLSADYGRLTNVESLASSALSIAPQIDIVINNAARPGSPSHTLSADGNETTLQVDYLAPVGLTTVLLARLAPHRRLRVVNIASATHLSATLDLDDLDFTRGYSAVEAYARAKLAIVTYSCWLADHLSHSHVEVVSMHPGVIATQLLHSMFSIGGDSPDRAAEAIVAVAGRSGDSGAYYDEARRADPNPLALDPAFQRRLHELTVERLERGGISAA